MRRGRRPRDAAGQYSNEDRLTIYSSRMRLRRCEAVDYPSGMRIAVVGLLVLTSCAPGVDVRLGTLQPVPVVASPRGSVALDVQDARTSVLLSTFDAGIGPAQPIRLQGDAAALLRDAIATELARSGVAVGSGPRRLRAELLSCALGREQDRTVVTTMIRIRAGDFERIYRASVPVGGGLGLKPTGTAATASIAAVPVMALADPDLQAAIAD